MKRISTFLLLLFLSLATTLGTIDAEAGNRVLKGSRSGNVAPSVVTPPSIIGTPQDGVSTSYTAGTYSGTPTPSVTARKWQLDSGGGFADISGATGSTYSPVTGDVGSSLRVVETATNVAGSTQGTSTGVTVIAAAAGYNIASAVAGVNSAYGTTFAVPTFPNWGSTNVNVNSCGTLSTALASGSKKITIQSGTTLNCQISITQNDTWLYAESGVSVPYTTGGTAISVAANRVRVEFSDDASVISNGINISGARSDIHFYGGQYIVNTGSRPFDAINGCARVAVERVQMQITTANNIVAWSTGCSNIIIANSKSWNDAGGQANVRMPETDGMLVMDSWLRNRTGVVGTAGQNIRTTCSAAPCTSGNRTTTAVWTRNLVDGGGLGDVVEDGGTNFLYITDNYFSWDGGPSNFSTPYPKFLNRRATGNFLNKFQSHGYTFEGDASGGSWTNSGNTYNTTAGSWSAVSNTLWNGTGNFQ